MKTNMKSYSNSDFAFLAAIIVAFSLATWVLVAPGTGKSGGARTELVGTITYKNHFAERRVSGEVVWDGLEQSAPVYNDDIIRTTTDSSAIIVLKNATEISLGEKTMVLVSMAPQGTSINISGGFVAIRQQVSVTDGKDVPALPITMTTSSGSVSLQNGSVSIADTAGKTAVNVESGTATVSSGKSSQDVGENSVVGLGGAKPVAMELVPQSPQSGQMVFLSDDSPKVSLQWKSSTANQAAELAGRVLIAADSDFRNIEYQGAIRGNDLAIALGEGTHYWKLAAAGLETPPRWFSVLLQRPPLILEPAENKSYNYESTLPLVRFAWKPLNFAMSYRLEIYGSANPGQALVSKATALSNLAVDTLPEGDYQWRVVAVSSQKGLEFASPLQHLSIKNLKMAAPLIQVAADTANATTPAAVLSTVAVGNGGAVAAWKEVDGADQYVATVSRDAAGTEVVATVHTTSNSLHLEKPLDPGTYYVRVSAISGKAASDASKALLVQVVEPFPLRAVLPVQDATLDPGTRTIPFRWVDPNKGNHFRVLLATEASFAQPFLSANGTATNLAITLPPDRNGTLLWKVQLLDASGSVVSSSEAASFFLPVLFEDPRAVSPKNGEQVDINKNEVIKLSWVPIKGAGEYRVSLYRMSGNLKSPIRSSRFKERPALLDRDTPNFLRILFDRPVGGKFTHPRHIEDGLPGPGFGIEKCRIYLMLTGDVGLKIEKQQIRVVPAHQAFNHRSE